ncbi:MAG TPA: Flp family type IVb pilin [Microvirga sp.]|nr:Flp family type IVb pilin [Microvirga sp.]
MTKLLSRFRNDESGATAIEYGLIAALIAIAIIGGLNLAGPALTSIFTEIGTTLQKNS